LDLDTERTIRLEVGRARRGTTRTDDEADARPARLLLRLDDGRDLPLDRALKIGCAPDNDLVLDDPYVSGWHCVVTRESGRFLVVDCGSRNGTFLGGVRVGSGELTPGARLTVGRTAMRVVADGARPRDLGLLGDSATMRRLRQRIATVAPTRATVLVLGESGTGKELAARALHDESRRAGAFVVVNCGAISPELVESELFGHERGAFTGAVARRRGVFEEADGGTLFLDEIGELPPSLQPKLLRVLESGMVRAVGAAGERKVDVRVVCATHRDLEQQVAKGGFRLDLFHRLSTVTIEIPPLRERRDDIALLADHFLDQVADEAGRKALSPAAREALAGYRWPGNVRELRNAIHRAAIFGGAILRPEDLFAQVARAAIDSGRVAIDGRRLDEIERDVIAVALRRHKGNRRAAAHLLGVPKSTFCDKVRRYQLAAE